MVHPAGRPPGAAGVAAVAVVDAVDAAATPVVCLACPAPAETMVLEHIHRANVPVFARCTFCTKIMFSCRICERRTYGR